MSIAEHALVIDSHTHILPDEFKRDRARAAAADATFAALFADARARTASADDLLSSMDAANVDASVAAGYGWTDQGIARLANDHTLEAATRHPGRIVPFCSVNPLWGEAAAREVRRCAELGARGIGELHPDTQGFADAGPKTLARLAPLMEAAKSYKLPVLVHASEPVGHTYPGKGTFTPERVLALAQAYPANTFIFAHFGGGLPFYAAMPEVAETLRNVYFDSAAQPLLYRPAAYTASVAGAGPERLLFGSDFPLVSQERALQAARAARLGSGYEAAALSGNAAFLFGLTHHSGRQ